MTRHPSASERVAALLVVVLALALASLGIPEHDHTFRHGPKHGAALLVTFPLKTAAQRRYAPPVGSATASQRHRLAVADIATKH